MFELFVNGVAEAVADAFRAGATEGRVAVIGAPRLAKALRDRGVDAIAVGPWSRALRKAAGTAVCAGAALPFADGSLAGAVFAGPGDRHEPLRELSRVVRAQGTLALVSREDPVVVTTEALNAGLLEIEQRPAGRAAVVSGRVLGPL